MRRQLERHEVDLGAQDVAGAVGVEPLAAGLDLGDGGGLELGQVTDELNIPVLAYGIRTDFQGEPFEGSRYLLAWADNLIELKAICHCGSKATMVIRMDENGNAVTEGSQVEIGGNDRYVSMCRKHFKQNFYREKVADAHRARVDKLKRAAT